MEEISTLRILKTPENFTFSKVEFTDDKFLEKFKDKIRKDKLIPFALEKCDEINHLYFYGKEKNAKEVCKILEKEGASWCVKITRDTIGGVNCIVREVER